MNSYYRVMRGGKSAFAEQCFAGNFIGADFDIEEDLSHKLPDEWRTFNKEFVPVWLAAHPGKSKIAAGLSCGSLWTVAKGIRKNDIVLCPDGAGAYRVGEVIGDYQYAPGQVLPHQRPVEWLSHRIDRVAMSDALKSATGFIGTACNISGHREEIEKLIVGGSAAAIVSTARAARSRSGAPRLSARWCRRKTRRLATTSFSRSSRTARSASGTPTPATGCCSQAGIWTSRWSWRTTQPRNRRSLSRPSLRTPQAAFSRASALVP